MSVGRVIALQAQDPEFNPQHHKTEQNKIEQKPKNVSGRYQVFYGNTGNRWRPLILEAEENMAVLMSCLREERTQRMMTAVYMLNTVSSLNIGRMPYAFI